MVSEERLKNWAWYCAWGHVGPEVRTTAASAEGNYESDDVFEGEEPRLEPDMLDGQLVENAIRQLPEMSRKVLKARYIMYPYHLKHTVSQRLRISVAMPLTFLAMTTPSEIVLSVPQRSPRTGPVECRADRWVRCWWQQRPAPPASSCVL